MCAWRGRGLCPASRPNGVTLMSRYRMLAASLVAAGLALAPRPATAADRPPGRAPAAPTTPAPLTDDQLELKGLNDAAARTEAEAKKAEQRANKSAAQRQAVRDELAGLARARPSSAVAEQRRQLQVELLRLTKETRERTLQA